MPKRELRHHERLPLWPNFALPNDEIDGLLPSCRVNSWEHFMDCIRKPNHLGMGIEQEMIYRGQRRYDWGLSSTLSRQYDGGNIPDDDIKFLLAHFKSVVLGSNTGFQLPDDEKEIWAHGQHNNLYTPLLDWSRSPFVALYFAFWEPDDDSDNTSRVIFCLNMTLLKKLFSEDESFFYEPQSHQLGRLIRQAGLFTITPSGSENFASYIIQQLVDNNKVNFDGFEDTQTIDGETEFPISEAANRISRYFCKIHIPNQSTVHNPSKSTIRILNLEREKCLNMLRLMNIHHGNLFPDLFGASIYTNDLLHRKQYSAETWNKLAISLTQSILHFASVTTLPKHLNEKTQRAIRRIFSE